MALIGDGVTTENATEPTGTKRKNPFNTQQLKEERERRQKKRARLIVRNISYKVTEESLREHFQQWGTLEDVNLLKRSDGKLVGCAFVQYATVNEATKAILKGNNQALLGRPVFVDWALGKDEYTAKKKQQEDPEEKKPKVEIKEDVDAVDGVENNDDEGGDDKAEKIISDEDQSIKSEDSADEDEDDNEKDDDDDENHKSDDNDASQEASGSDNEDKKDLKAKDETEKVEKEKHISNDVQEGCTVFIKNVSFDAEEADLRKVCRKYGPLYYAIINRDRISKHSKGTAFVKFKTKESADLCLQAGTEFILMEQVLDPHPALSREEIHNQTTDKSKLGETKDSRNLYLVREGLIMSGSKAADGVSASDMTKRHKLEQSKTQMLKNLNRFVSRNRLSIHNLPLNYDNDKLKQMIIIQTSFRPHECRVMRENKITAEHPLGKSKGFGFVSFNTHQEALTALRKLNNNPTLFGTEHRPIVAFSIEDRAVQKIREKRQEKSKLNNPTFKEKLEKRKEQRKAKVAGKAPAPRAMGPRSDSKTKLQKHIKQLEEKRAAKAKAESNPAAAEQYDNYVGMAAKPGTSIRMRSNKKINEQASVHMKRVKADKRKEKQRKIKQTHLAERQAVVRTKQGRKVEHDDLAHLVNKYKKMIDSTAKATAIVGDGSLKTKKPKRTKWYTE